MAHPPPAPLGAPRTSSAPGDPRCVAAVGAAAGSRGSDPNSSPGNNKKKKKQRNKLETFDSEAFFDVCSKNG